MILTSARIIKKVAKETGFSERVVRAVWASAVKAMKDEILGQGEVRITGFLHVKPHILRTRSRMSKGVVVPTIRVSASVSSVFREELRQIIIPEGE